MFVVATATAIVASQALISATFQIVKQARASDVNTYLVTPTNCPVENS